LEPSIDRQKGQSPQHLRVFFIVLFPIPTVYMLISAIVARSANGVIGANNRLPWHLPADLAQFRRLTTGHHLVMGRKTYESIGRPLPNRVSLVLTRQADWVAPAGAKVVGNWEEALVMAKLAGETELFVIGGAEVFALFMPVLDRLYLTQVHAQVAGDVFFPAPDPAHWRETERQAHLPDAKNDLGFDFVVYDRR
jgi:dihydrofolate reductase